MQAMQKDHGLCFRKINCIAWMLWFLFELHGADQGKFSVLNYAFRMFQLPTNLHKTAAQELENLKDPFAVAVLYT